MLGPVLFIIYINDLLFNVNSYGSCVRFAFFSWVSRSVGLSVTLSPPSPFSDFDETWMVNRRGLENLNAGTSAPFGNRKYPI